jgi:hypothetical protein
VLADFGAVHDFLADTYTVPAINGMYLPQFFEYAHTHPAFNPRLTHRMTVWEDGGKISAFCGYELDIGEAYIVAGRGYESLLPRLLAAAEENLTHVLSDGRRELSVSVTSAQPELDNLLRNRGYEVIYTEPIRIFRYKNGFREVSLPDGYSCVPLSAASDWDKLDRCIWRGFNHGDSVEYDADARKYMLAGPHCRPELGRVIIAPDGEYACMLGMWYDDHNRYAYLEPLCTVPEHRRKGLAAYALTDAMRATATLGAEYCFGGVVDFYIGMGFETLCERRMWRKEW